MKFKILQSANDHTLDKEGLLKDPDIVAHYITQLQGLMLNINFLLEDIKSNKQLERDDIIRFMQSYVDALVDETKQYHNMLSMN